MRITERDRALLAYVAEHRLVLVTHAQALMRTSTQAAYQRLATLAKAGLLSRRTVFDRQPGCYQITRAGLGAIGSDLPPPRLDLRCYEHDVGVAWLWLAARAGAFGQLGGMLSERRMRSEDASGRVGAASAGRTHGVRLGGLGPGGGPRLHYPDLVLVDRRDRRIALELELSAKGRTRRERILAGYGADPRLDAVLYLCTAASVERGIRAGAARVGVGSLVHVQRLRWRVRDVPRAEDGAPQRSRGRGSPARERSGSAAR
jgi:hypothetical protein